MCQLLQRSQRRKQMMGKVCKMEHCAIGRYAIRLKKLKVIVISSLEVWVEPQDQGQTMKEISLPLHSSAVLKCVIPARHSGTHLESQCLLVWSRSTTGNPVSKTGDRDFYTDSICSWALGTNSRNHSPEDSGKPQRNNMPPSDRQK